MSKGGKLLQKGSEEEHLNPPSKRTDMINDKGRLSALGVLTPETLIKRAITLIKLKKGNEKKKEKTP